MQLTSQNYYPIGTFPFFICPPPPPPPLWKATSHAGPFRIFFQRSQQNFELQRFRQQISWVPESLPPSPNVENLWDVPFMTKIVVFYYHINDPTKNLITHLWVLGLTHPKHKLWRAFVDSRIDNDEKEVLLWPEWLKNSTLRGCTYLYSRSPLRVMVYSPYKRVPPPVLFKERKSKRMQGWLSGESARLPPLWPGFNSWTGHHKWVGFVVGSHPCSEGFSPPSTKPNTPNSNLIWKWGHRFVSFAVKCHPH